MQARATRIPISLQPAQRQSVMRQTRADHAPTPQLETPKKKILINRRVVPKITIRVDELIRETFSSLANGKLQHVSDSPAVLNNEALLEYIRAIYETYDIEDPMLKYGKGSYPREQQSRMSESNWKGHPATQPSGDTLEISKVELVQRTAENRNALSRMSASGAGESEPRRPVADRPIGQRASSKSKISRLKDSIREGSNYQPIEVRTISLSHKKSSASIKKRIMFGSPSQEKDSNQLENTLGHTGSFQKQDLSTSHIERLSQSQRLNFHPALLSNAAETSSYEQQSGEINPTFRYCFMCECSILEANIGFHEKNCRNFMELYSMEWQDVVRLLESKIAGVKHCINNVLSSEEQDNVERRIRESVVKWMGEIKNAEDNGLAFGSQFETSYDRIVRHYQSQSFRLLELAYKLRWFLKIRERIKDKFGI